MTSTRLLLARQLMNRMAKRNRKGFTLIELLVVVVIIGILASVALPSFVGAQDKARNASVQSNCRTIQMALEEYSTENNGAYPGSAASADWTKLLTFLPGGKMPRSPWAGTGVTQTTNTVPDGKILLDADATVAQGKAMTTVNTKIDDTGVVPPSAAGAFAAKVYGAISYDDEAREVEGE